MIIPPNIPAIIPEESGALEARAMPRHSGRATKKTTMEDLTSEIILLNIYIPIKSTKIKFYQNEKIDGGGISERR